MSASVTPFNRGVVNPIDCYKAGWNLIKERYWLFMGISAVGILLGSVAPMGLLLGPMMCGIFFCLFAHIRGEKVSLEMLFKGFDYFSQSLIATLVQIIPVFLVALPVYVIFFIMFMGKMNAPRGRGTRGAPPVDPSELVPMFAVMGALVLVVLLVSVIVGAFFMFTYPLIVDRRLAALDAIKTSIRAALGNLGGVIGLVALNLVLGFAGMLLCYVGAFLVLPIGFAAWAVAYRRVFPAQTT
ncbi:MAG TPA: hypothetical protein VM911_05360 [Pyrinomonadaceae bacterium]|jgi:uncharacterized membrane protein|nr:hypothetical protein [Pyrinomonadaceae bacterium]